MTAADFLQPLSRLEIDSNLIEKIAEDTQAPRDLVQRYCEEALAEIAPAAKITQFLNVIVNRRVRLRLRQH